MPCASPLLVRAGYTLAENYSYWGGWLTFLARLLLQLKAHTFYLSTTKYTFPDVPLPRKSRKLYSALGFRSFEIDRSFDCKNWDVTCLWSNGKWIHPSTDAVPSECMKRWFNSTPSFNQEDFLSRILLLDQFTRNAFKGTKQMFCGDTYALALAKRMMAFNLDEALHPLMRIFVYLPFEHSEDIDDQKTSLQLFSKLFHAQSSSVDSLLFSISSDYAARHHKLIEEFGRFPYRNAILGRICTEKEKIYIENGGDDFISANKN
ncbi:hypothetical protein MDAP_002606 [Mitosporidium daphniae]